MRVAVLLAVLVFHIDTQHIHGKHHEHGRSQRSITKVAGKNIKRQLDWTASGFLKDNLESYNVTHWTSKLNLQQCVIVEIGEGYCSIFVETRREIGYNASGLPVDELYLGLVECWRIRSWHICNPQLKAVRPDDCSFTEATNSQEFSARVHRRLCDVTYMSRNVRPSNCSQNLADQPLIRVIGFPTCFQSPLPDTICYPRSVCGSFKCISKKNSWCAHTFSCDTKCIGGQKFCEDSVFPTSAPQQVISRWSEWGPLHCNASGGGSGFMISEAQCINQYSCEPELDCLGPGLSCCPANSAGCKCSVNYLDNLLIATRIFGPCCPKKAQKCPSNKCPITTCRPVTETTATPSCSTEFTTTPTTSCTTTTDYTPPPTTECPTATEIIDKVHLHNVKKDGTGSNVEKYTAEELYKRLEEYKSRNQLKLSRQQNLRASCQSRHLLAFFASEGYDYDDDDDEDGGSYYYSALKDEGVLKREAPENKTNKTTPSKMDDDDDDNEDEEQPDKGKDKSGDDDIDGEDDDDDDDLVTEKPKGNSTAKYVHNGNKTNSESSSTTKMSWADRLNQLKTGGKKKTTPEDEEDEVIQNKPTGKSKSKLKSKKKEDDDDGIAEQQDAEDDDDDDDDYDDDDGPMEKKSKSASHSFQKTKGITTYIAYLIHLILFL